MAKEPWVLKKHRHFAARSHWRQVETTPELSLKSQVAIAKMYDYLILEHDLFERHCPLKLESRWQSMQALTLEYIIVH